MKVGDLVRFQKVWIVATGIVVETGLFSCIEEMYLIGILRLCGTMARYLLKEAAHWR